MSISNTKAGWLLLALLCTDLFANCRLVPTDCLDDDAGCGPVVWLERAAIASARVCSMDRLLAIQPGNGSAVLTELQKLAALGSSGAPTTRTFGSIPGGETYIGGVLAPNGKIYAIPYDATRVAVIDPDNSTVSMIGNTFPLGFGKWAGGVLAQDGKIYGIPYNATQVLVIDPDAGTSTVFGPSLTAASKWAGAVLAPNGRIYGVSAFSGSVLMIEPDTGTVSTIPGLAATQVFEGGVLSIDGLIHWMPANATTTNFATFNPLTQTISQGVATTAGQEYFSAVMAPSGDIFGLPVAGTTVVRINPFTHTNTAVPTTTTSWVGGALAANGKIYGMPFSATTYLEIDPGTPGANLFSSAPVGAKWQGAVLALNGKIYGIPLGATSVAEIDPHANGVICPALALSGYLNKF